MFNVNSSGVFAETRNEVNQLILKNLWIDHSVSDKETITKAFVQTKQNESVLQLFTHGRPGELLIDGEWRNAIQIAQFLNEQWINTSCKIQSINIYACNFARGQIGKDAVEYLQNALQLNIAASNDLTGRDGNWILEVGQPLAAIAVYNYDGNLQTTPYMNIHMPSDRYNVCLKLGFTGLCYTTSNGGVYDIAVNASGTIAVNGSFSSYNYLNSTGVITNYSAPQFGFLNNDFTYDVSFLPTYSVTVDDTIQPGFCIYPYSKQFISATKDDCFIYLQYYNNSVNEIYKVCDGGLRTLLYSPSAVNVTALTTSTLGDYFFIAERTGINGPHDLRKVSTVTGAIDPNFTYQTPTGIISQIVEAPNGKIYIIDNSTSTNTLKRLTSTGAVDGTFMTHDDIASIALQSTGKVIAGGTFTNLSSLTRYNIDGTVDPTFNTITDCFIKNTVGPPYTTTDERATITRIQINAADEIYVRGNFHEINGYYSMQLAKLSSNGIYDNTFRLNLKGGIQYGIGGGATDIQLQPDGKLLVALGDAQHGFANIFQSGIVRLLPNGKLDTEINNTATNLDAKVPTKSDLLISLNSWLGNGGPSASTPTIAYNLADYANFNKVGYNANPSFNGDTIAGAFAPSELEYSLVNNLYYKASWNQLVAFKTTDASITGMTDVVWAVTLPPATASNSLFVYDLQVSADGNYIAVVQGIYNVTIYNAKTGALLASNIVSPQGFSAAYQPMPPYNLFHLKMQSNYTLCSVTKYDNIGQNPVNIDLENAPYLGVNTQSKIVFYSPLDFYILDDQFIYKYKLVTSSTDLTPNPNGTYAIRDVNFGVSGVWDLGTTNTDYNPDVNPQYDGLTVGPDGSIYIMGKYNSCSRQGGSNVAKISSVGKTIDLNFIQAVSIPNSNSQGYSQILLQGYYDMALGQLGSCTTVPDITLNGVNNICPSTTVDLSSLAISSTTPAGSTLVWSTTSTPTASDTLTNLNVGAGKYYAFYYDQAFGCFGPADSLTVTLITCLCSDPSKMAASCDFDGDGILNYLDIDDDNDGILDIIENGCTKNGASAFTNVSTTANSPFLEQAWYYPGNIMASNQGNVSRSFTVSSSTTVNLPLTGTITNPIISLSNNDYFKQVWTDQSGNPVTFVPIDVSPDLRVVGDTIYDVDDCTVSNGLSAAGSLIAIGTFTSFNVQWILNPGGCNAPDGNSISILTECSSVLDTDGDGIPNQFDLDSDADGCSDAFEGGATTNSTVSTFAGPYDSNGYANSLEKLIAYTVNITRPVPNFTDTYDAFAIWDNINKCGGLDFDGDGIPDYTDLDDDNDGILDAVESPSCFMTAAEQPMSGDRTSVPGFSISSDIDYLSPNPLIYAIDGINTDASNAGPNYNLQLATSGEAFRLTFPNPVQLTSVNVLYGPAANAAFRGTFYLRGSNDGVNWSTLSASQALAATSPINPVFTVTMNAGNYKFYALYSSSAINGWTGQFEVTTTLNTATYNPSAHPKVADCTTDYDGDGILNHLDLDSDGDGCTDALESGVTAIAGVTMQSGNVINGMPNTTTSTPNAVVAGPYDGNGFANSVENPTETGVYKGSYSYSDAINPGVLNCPQPCSDPTNMASNCDFDGDGINNNIDLDDDNDGVLDTLECGTTALVSTMAD
ncbi:MAG: DUF4347 domain-containing protein [Saprospiraceae bacterium]|nr:DUF4347 domain-containing protein [Saprospiraceae bacterium]